MANPKWLPQEAVSHKMADAAHLQFLLWRVLCYGGSCCWSNILKNCTANQISICPTQPCPLSKNLVGARKGITGTTLGTSGVYILCYLTLWLGTIWREIWTMRHSLMPAQTLESQGRAVQIVSKGLDRVLSDFSFVHPCCCPYSQGVPSFWSLPFSLSLSTMRAGLALYNLFSIPA